MCQRARPRKVHLHPLSRTEIDQTVERREYKIRRFYVHSSCLFSLRLAYGDGSTLNETYVLEAALRQAEIWLSPEKLMRTEVTMTLPTPSVARKRIRY